MKTATHFAREHTSTYVPPQPLPLADAGHIRYIRIHTHAHSAETDVCTYVWIYTEGRAAYRSVETAHTKLRLRIEHY